MPLYVYAVINDDGSEGEVFEVLQSMSEDALTEHPVTGQPVKRLLSAPNTTRKYGESNTRGTLSNSNLERLGFTRYQKAGGGRYEKTAGAGPDVIAK